MKDPKEFWNKLQCVSCGDMVVSLRSHTPFCKGVDKGEPWKMLPINQGNVNVWSKSKKFLKWAKDSGISLSKFQQKNP